MTETTWFFDDNGSLHLSDGNGSLILKSVLVLSMITTFILNIVIICVYILIRAYQKDREITISQFDKIDYLINLITEQEEIINDKMLGLSDEEIQEKMGRYVALNKELMDNVEHLHEVLAEKRASWD